MRFHITQHARDRFRKRFKKLKRDGELEYQAERARQLGTDGDRIYFLSPCGAVLVVNGDVLKTVLKGSHLSDQLNSKFRNNNRPCQ